MESPRLKLIRSIRQRKSQQQFGYGIGLASAYIESLGPCLADDECFKRMMSGISFEQWESARKKANGQLVYSEKETDIVAKRPAASSESEMKAILAEVKDAPELPKHCALVFKNIVTTCDEDRDRDILLPNGAQVDKSMPLLWQHLQPHPIGKLLGTIEQNDRYLKVASCICDVSDLAHDSIKMVESGILRISHGFKPKEFSQLPMKSGDQVPAGFLVSKYEIVEESLVSVPANSGAVVEAWASLVSRKSLKSDLVKSLGDRMYELRDTRSMSFGGLPAELMEAKPQEITVKVVVENLTKQDACACHVKDTESEDETTEQVSAEQPHEETESTPSEQKSLIGCPSCAVLMDSSGACESCGYTLGKSLPEATRKALGIEEDCLVRISRFADCDKSVKNGSIQSKLTGERMIAVHVVPKGHSPRYDMPRTVKLFANIEGSFEWITQMLSEQVKGFMASQAALGNVAYNRDSPDYDWCYLEATMSDSVIICIDGRSGTRYYKVAYTLADGKPSLSASTAVSEVEATAVVRESKSMIMDRTFDVGTAKVAMPTPEQIKKLVAIVSLSNASENLQALKEIASISQAAVDSINADNESRQLEQELTALLG